MTRRGRFGPGFAMRGEDIGVLGQLERRLAPPSFFIFCVAAPAARQSATAAAQMAMSAGRPRARRQASPAPSRPSPRARRRDRASDRTGHQRHLGAERGRGARQGMALLAGGAVGDVAHGVDRLVRGAGGDEHAHAGERLIGSCPRAARAASPRSFSIAATIACGSAMRPGPYSPHAISPSSGPTKRFRRRSVATLRSSPDAATSAHSWRAPRAPACRWQAARSGRDRSARPCAILARRSAVAGATTTRSASRDSRICPISASSLRSKSSVKTFSPVSTESESGVTNCGAALGQDRAHRGAPLLQAAHEIEALIGGDAAADDQEDALAVHVAFTPLSFRRSRNPVAKREYSRIGFRRDDGPKP